MSAPLHQGNPGNKGSQGQAATWRDRLPEERLESRFSDFKAGLGDAEAADEAARCINCFEAPCTKVCPTSINIPQFISRIASGNVRGAAKTILEANVLGLSCARSCPVEVLCEGECVYHDLNKKPISIGKLQRYAVEQAYERGYHFFEAGAPTGKRVALVGAGPASLACAHELRRHGHETVIFEKSEIPGGLNATGIAPYKMKADTALSEVERVLALGVKVEYGKELGRNLKLEELVSGHDAVFLGLGLGPDSRLDARGAEHPLIQGAVDWVSRLKTASASRSPSMTPALDNVKTALVVGGGNSALDACRELKQLGVERVVVSYRRGRDAMSGYAHEAACAMQEGVEFRFHSLPVEFKPSGPRLEARLARTQVDAGTGRVRTLDGSDEQLAVDLVLVATGQARQTGLLEGVPGLKIQDGALVADPETGRTGNPKIFAAGDLVNGGKEVVNAVDGGKKAAAAIHALLTGQRGGK